jgi:hypothetical protein
VGNIQQFIVVEFTDMPGRIQDAVIAFYENHIPYTNGVYVPFDNWGNTVEGSIASGLLIERWMEANVPELAGRREREDWNGIPVLIHANW